MTVGDVLGAWTWDPLPTFGAVLAGAGYAAAWRDRRRPETRGRRASGRGVLSWSRPAFFGAGLLTLLVAVDGPPDVFAESSFLAHMVQHVLLQMVAAPLLVLGGSVGLVLRADPPWCRRRFLVGALRSRTVGKLTHPVTAFAAFALLLVVSHLSPLYDLALQHEWVHELEHVGYLLTALLFWWSAIGVDPAPHRMSPPARLLYLFVSMPVTALLGVAIAGADHVLYSSYLVSLPPWGSTPLADQHAAGTLMWVSGMFTVVPAMGAVLWRWLEEEDMRQSRGDALARSWS